MAEQKIKKVNAYWTFVEKNDGDNADEEPGLVMVLWNEKKMEWGKFLPLEEVKAAMGANGKAHIQVTRNYPYVCIVLRELIV